MQRDLGQIDILGEIKWITGTNRSNPCLQCSLLHVHRQTVTWLSLLQVKQHRSEHTERDLFYGLEVQWVLRYLSWLKAVSWGLAGVTHWVNSMPVPGADSTREAAWACLSSTGAKVRNACWAVQICVLPPSALLLLSPTNKPLASGSREDPGARGSSGMRPVFLAFASVSWASGFIIQSSGGIFSERLFKAVSDLFAYSNH